MGLVFKKIALVLRSKWTLLLVGFLAFVFIIWFGGPLIAVAGKTPLADAATRWFVIAVFAVLVVGYQWGRHAVEKKHQQAAVQTLLEGEDGESSDEASVHEVDTLRERIQAAIEVLKKSKLTGGLGIYQLPWYVMIGPPGTGKTTALQNSGLEFPLKDKLGTDPLSGVGGTRFCDWWFTNKAVLIDTAGRYTTQDSHSVRDSRAWLGFLGLLKKYRTRRPINGAIVTISLVDLIQQTRTERNLHARTIKQRILELKNQLGLQFPVYVMLTKADLVAGFSEYFDDLSAKEREQFWGVTFPMEANNPEAGVVGEFNSEFRKLLEQIQARLNKRLHHERVVDKRSLIFEFPKQLQLLQPVIDDFLNEIFIPNAFEEAPMLRGVFIVSATQQGKPIDQVAEGTSNHLGLGQVVTPLQATATKGFFLKDAFENIIFKEQFVGTVNRKHQKFTLLAQRSVIAVCSALLIICSALWYNSYQWNKRLVDSSASAIAKYQHLVEPELTPQTDIFTLVQALNTLRDLPAGYSNNMPEEGVANMGLYQGDKIGLPSKLAYERALSVFFSEYLTDVLVTEMRHNESYLEYLYETLKTYLMLVDTTHRNEDDIMSWFEVYFERAYTGEVNQVLRNELLLHVRSLLALPTSTLSRDDDAVAQARSVLTAMSLSERAYQRLKLEFLSSHLPDFSLRDVLGRRGRQVLSLDNDMPESIPGLYTYNGYHGIFRLENSRVVKRLMEDSWVYGDQLTIDESTREAVIDSVNERYFKDYIHHWQQLLSGVRLASFSSVPQGLEVTQALTSSERPIQSVITAAQKELRLTHVSVDENIEAAAEVAGNVADVALRNQKARLNRFMPSDAGKLRLALPGQEVEDAFVDLLSVTDDDLALLSKSIVSVDNYLEGLSESRQKGAFASLVEGGSISRVMSDMRSVQRSLPKPFSQWTAQLTDQTSALASQGAQVHVNKLWHQTIYQEYQSAIYGKYPFSPKAKQDVNIKDFARFFGYGGKFDQFFNQYLQASVDTTGKRWILEKNVGVDQASLTLFQQARRIRNMFFEPGTQKLRLEFGLKPLYLDGHINNLRVELGEQTLIYRHGPQRVSQFVWPTPSKSDTRLSFVPPKSGHAVSETYRGDWGLFKMLDQLAVQRPESRSDNVLDIVIKGNRAKLVLIPATTQHPFWSSDLTRFVCPSKL